MAQKRRHHYIPQFYLRGFADPGTPLGQKPWLWVLDVHSGSIAKRTPKNIAVEIGYYAIETADGKDYETVENELARIEDQAAFALRQMLSRPVGSRGVVLPEISTFIAWLACRTPWFRRIATDGWPKQLEDLARGRIEAEDDPDLIVLIVNQTTGERRKIPLEDALAAIRSGPWVAQMHQNQVIDIMRLQRWYFQHQYFSMLSWTVLTAPTDQFFITSDRPVVWYVPGQGFADSPAGLKYPEVELTIPLNAKTALLGTAAPLPPGAQIGVDAINFRTRCFAERFLASPDLKNLK
jgi:hypothetical protein